MADPIVELDDVWVWRNGNLALKAVSLKIGQGKFIGLMGPNGGGKSTLLDTIVGLIRPDRGRVVLRDPEALKIGYVPQEENVDPNFPVTVYDVVEMGLYGTRRIFLTFGEPERRRIMSVLAQVGMDRHHRRPIGELSGGQKQRVFIARAIVGKPRLLLLDEPTTGVDAKARDDFYRVLTGLIEDLSLTVILASHELEVVPSQVDEIICVNQTVFVHARPEDIEDTDVFRRAYGCELEFMLHGRYPHRVLDHHGEEGSDV